MSVSAFRTSVAVAAGSPVVVVEDVVAFGALVLVEFALDIWSVSVGRSVFMRRDRDIDGVSIRWVMSRVSTSHDTRVGVIRVGKPPVIGKYGLPITKYWRSF